MFKPMLAKNIKIRDLKLPVMVSRKLEGVRAEFTPIGLRTRPMKKFGNSHVELFFAELSAYCRANQIYMEGEIYIHGVPFNDISSICRRQHHPDTDTLKLYIFDMWDPAWPDCPACERYGRLCNIVDHLQIAPVFVARQSFMEDHDLIEDKYQEVIEDGYEGLCFKSPNQKYKGGRPTKPGQQFMRIKPDNTYDGYVLEIVERMENLVESEYNELGLLSKRQDKDQKAHTGMAAVAITQCADFPDPVRVVLSKNLTDSDRAEIWDNRNHYEGKHLRFWGIPVPGMDQPRAPRFDVWRTDLD
jgi:ATP-dependent DNA ligase